MYQLLLISPIEFVIVFGSLLLSLTVHEFAHAWVADRLGDPTPRMQGRVTLNPLAHLDPLGTLAMFLTHFGWGKPVQIDPFNFKHQIKDSALVALAGPAVNITIAIVATIIFRLMEGNTAPNLLSDSLLVIITLNVVLAVFNLIPIHPLDGSKIIVPLLPRQTAFEYEHFMERYGFALFLALIIPWYQGNSPLSFLIRPVISFITTLLLY